LLLIHNTLTVNEVTVLSVKKHKIYFKTVTDKMTVGRFFVENFKNLTKIGQNGRN